MKKALLLAFCVLSLIQIRAQVGTLDPSFGTGGFVSLGISYDAAAFQSDGKLIGVQMITGGFKLTRYKTDGTVDESFGNSGTSTTIIPFLTTPSKVLIAIHPTNDKIVVRIEGESSYIQGYYHKTIGMARLSSNGLLDDSFGINGIMANNYSLGSLFIPYAISALIIQTDEKILTTTLIHQGRISYVVIDRYDAKGNLELGNSFNKYLVISAIVIGNNNEITVGFIREQYYSPRNTQAFIETLNGSGNIIKTFGTSNNVPYSVLAVQPDGKVLAVFESTIYRYTTSGNLDETFGMAGSVNLGFKINRIIVQDDGRIVVGGTANGDFALARLNSDGSLNYTFGDNGKTITDFGGTESIYRMKIANEKLFVYGSGILAVYRLQSACTPPTFAPTIIDATCGNSNGKISVLATSGAAPWQYSIDAGQNYVAGPDEGYTFTNLDTGLYKIRLKDKDGCESDVMEKKVDSDCLPSITSFTPAFGAAGSSVTITGKNFSPTPTDNIVYFGAVKATVANGTGTSLTVIVPKGATYQPISVTTNGLTAYSPQSFILTFPNSAPGFAAGSFAPKVDFPTAPNADIITVGDLDGDGRPDMVLGTNYNFSKINQFSKNLLRLSVFRNTGSAGNINFERTDLPLSFIERFAIADINGDGKLDIVAASYDTIFILKNTSAFGAISFSQSSFVINIPVRSLLAISDVDGDGRPDLVLPRFIGSAGTRFAVLRNISTDHIISFTTVMPFFGNGTSFTADDVTMADLDGDLRPDYVYPTHRNLSTGEVIMFEPHPAAGPFSTIGDVDGDGKPDLIASNNIQRNISVPGTIAFTVINLTQGIGQYPSIGDLDGDGKPDFAGVSTDLLHVSKNGSTIGNISLAPPVNYPAGSGGPTAIADFDGDGVPDIAVVNTSSNTVSVFRNLMGDVSTCTPPTFLNNNQIVLNANCRQNDGNISIIPTSGTAPFKYSIDGGATYVPGPDGGYTFDNLATGNYNLRLKDANGCESDIVQREVQNADGCSTPCVQPTFLNSNAIVLDASCGMNDGSISIIPTSGNAPFMYSIDGGVTYVSGPDAGYTFTGLAAGIYKLRLKNAEGCASEIVEKEVRAVYNCPPPIVLSDKNSGRSVTESSALSQAKIFTFPNPSKGRFKVQLQNFALGKAAVAIFDGKGTLIQKTQTTLTPNTTLDFDLSGHAPGLYYVRVISDSGMKVSKVIVQ